jgi:hypothetical protein
LKELVQRADQLWLTHRQPAMLAPVAQADQLEQLGEEALCAAVAGKAAGKKGSTGQQQKSKQKKTFCWRHHKYGKDARRCENPAVCQFEEN